MPKASEKGRKSQLICCRKCILFDW